MTYKSTYAITATEKNKNSKLFYCNHLGWIKEALLPDDPHSHSWIHMYKTASSARRVMGTFDTLKPWKDLYNFKVEHCLVREKRMTISEEERNANYVKYMAKYLPERELDMEHMTYTQSKPSRRYGKSTRSVKAIIRYNSYDGKHVVYYKQGGRFFKMLDNKTIRPMAKTIKHIHSIANNWTTKNKLNVVENDEQVLFSGVALNIAMEPFDIDTRLV